MAKRLEGKVAVITGGSSGIGKATALSLAREGANVVISGRGEEEGEAVVASIRDAGAQGRFASMDVRNESQVEALFRDTAAEFGRVDYAFNNAGIAGALGPITEDPEKSCADVLGVNVEGVFLCMKHALPLMLQQGEGTIVNTASFVGTTVPLPDGAVYGASKAAVLSMTSAVHAGYADQGIRVYAVCPWMTETPMLEYLTGGNADARAAFQSLNPSGEFVKAEEIAEVVVAMFAGDARFANGDAVLVDSGAAIQKIQMPTAV